MPATRALGSPASLALTALAAAGLGTLTAVALWPARPAGSPRELETPAAVTSVSASTTAEPLAETKARVRAALARGQGPSVADLGLLAAATPAPSELDRVAALGPIYELDALEPLVAAHPKLAALETLRALAALATGEPRRVAEARTALDARHAREGLARELRNDLEAIAIFAAWLDRKSEFDAVPEPELARTREVSDARDAVARLVGDGRCVGNRIIAAVVAPLEPALRAAARGVALHRPAQQFARVAILFVLGGVRDDMLPPAFALHVHFLRFAEKLALDSAGMQRIVLDLATVDARLAGDVERTGGDPVVAANGYLAAARWLCLGLAPGKVTDGDREEIARLSEAADRVRGRLDSADDRTWALCLEHDLERQRARVELGEAVAVNDPDGRRVGYEAALDDLRRALACDDRANGELENRRAGDAHATVDLLFELGRLDEAEPLLRALETLDPLRADLRRLRGDLAGAVDLATQRLASGDDDALPITTALAVRALARAAQGDLEGARADLATLRSRAGAELLPRLQASAITRRLEEEASRRERER